MKKKTTSNFIIFAVIILMTALTTCFFEMERNNPNDPSGDGVDRYELNDTFDGVFDTDNFTYDPANGEPYVSSGNMVIPSGTSILFTRKFKIPATIEGRGRLSDSASSSPNFGIWRKPNGYESDCIFYRITIRTGWDISNLYLSSSYWTSETTVDSQHVSTTQNETNTFDFKFIITANSQKIYINSTLEHEFNDSITENYWWSFCVTNGNATTTSELEWLIIDAAEAGDFSNLLPH